ncbi:hypothetical protein [Paraglaciecola sp. MB-3u-78]|jgi:DUF4097 and DUF4098 domain-containing protein YvlB|uniref:DUF4097 family beta strand repeat-containing protein n=1 Tax=Paraglaciecola sp. MB-3u-78 TaxID=2058332 RepID=UPI000C33A3A0|nr:hypothetical protein [Paraglaciecola sp. MB-3u-78]PKH00007.1 hypothetical protein CXF95_04995 [Paraglaciecola sp. MB-3u-78]
MKKLLIFAGFLCLSWTALADEKINRSLDVSKTPYVQIEHVNGSAKVIAWDKSEVKVTGTLGDRTEKFIFEKDDNEVLIKVKVENNRGWNNWGSDNGDDLEIFVPRQSKVYYSAVNADVELVQVRGGARVETVNGAIDVKELAGRIRLESVNGRITASSLEGDVKIDTVNGTIESRSSKGKEDSYESVNGNIEVFSESGDINVETVNGDIGLELGKVNQLNMDTVNGTIDVRLELAENGEIEASSVGGSIRLYLQSDVSARFDIEGHAGGNITNNLSADKMQKAKYGPNRWLKFSVNGGSAKVNVSTVSGRVKLDKK